MIAAGMTLALTAALTLYAVFTKTDFTMMGGSLFVCAIGLCIFGIFAGIFHKSCPVLHMLYSILAIILYGIYLVYDVQLLAGGRDGEFSLDDYIIASLNIYLDIIILFTRLLSLLSSRN